MDDLVVRGGDVLDGSGAPPVRADLAIADGRIARIVPRYTGTARREIDARGSIVGPGFIDIKTHSDFTLPYAPRAESKATASRNEPRRGPPSAASRRRMRRMRSLSSARYDLKDCGSILLKDRIVL